MNSIEIEEKKWIHLELKDDAFEFPRVEVSLSFDTERFRIKAVVHDMHFKDGDRSWRYGDGFSINFVTQTNPDSVESGRFYAYGFSIIAGQSTTTLINHNGIYFLSKVEHKPDIRLDVENHRADYSIDLPWHLLKPFHPLLHNTMGINIQYNSQHDDGSKTVLQLLDDEHFDSESKVEKQYVPVHFSCSDKSEFQFACELEDNLVRTEYTRARIAVYSKAKTTADLRVILSDPGGEVIHQYKKRIILQPGVHRLEVPLTTPNETGSYLLRLILDDNLARELEFYRVSTDEVADLRGRLKNLQDKAKEPHEISSYHSLTYILNDLEQQINELDSKESPRTIEQSVKTIRALLKKCESHNHIYTGSGAVRTAFLSQSDKTLQPYSIYLPEGFDLNRQYKLLVALHGSGVDESGLHRKYGRRFADLGYVVASPRGRDLSDWYVGQTESDVKEMVGAVKEMFNIEKTLVFGVSMGGYGVWRLTFLYPALFEGAIIASGAIRCYRDDEHPTYDIRSLRERARHIPYLVMHGTEDRAMPFKETEEFVETLDKEGFEITFEVHEGAGHGNYDPMEATKNWLLRFG